MIRETPFNALLLNATSDNTMVAHLANCVYPLGHDVLVVDGR
ncbi:hypothetical protein ACLB1S_08835 [Escherichia coli]